MSALDQVRSLKEQSHRLQADMEELKRRGIIEVADLKDHIVADHQDLAHNQKALETENADLKQAMADLNSTKTELEHTSMSLKVASKKLLGEERMMATVRMNLTGTEKA